MNTAPEQPRDLDYEAIVEGMEAGREYAITPAVYENFLAAFDDHSPIHVDEAHARARGFAGKVMHGAILNGFVSHFVGMHFPGRRSLLLSVDLRYAKPSFLGDRLNLKARVSQKVDAQRVIVLHLAFHNLTQGVIAATGRAQVAVGRD
ncbi:MAG: hypothetical protein HZA89_00925 [Verrucomicrobia bacterium]|nr:hypothetical protein [Verrucomicrobiota bacterium]